MRPYIFRLEGIALILAATLCLLLTLSDKFIHNNSFIKTIKTLYINMPGSEGKTSLMVAAEQGNLQNVKTLLSEGADVNAKDLRGWTALFYASSNNQKDGSVVSTLINAGANVNVTDKNGVTPLIVAVDPGGTHGNLEALLKGGGNPNNKGGGGEFPLRIATSWNSIPNVRLLLESGADANLTRDDGRTALMEAAEAGYVDLVKMLLDYGADVSVKDSDGKTALAHALNAKYPNERVRLQCLQVEEILRQHGAN